MNDKKLLIIGTVAALALLTGGATWMSSRSGNDADAANSDQFASCRTSVVAGGTAALGGSFELTNENGERVTEADVFTKPSLLYFGYSYCPDICPFDNSRNAEALDLLDEQGIDAQAVFVTVDPNRDTPEVMDHYTFNIHEKMIGLTGTEDDIAAAAKAWRVAYQVQDDGSDDYPVSHTTMTYLVLPEYGTMEFFNRDVTPEAMAEQTACFVNAG
ncbi:SCO family protein [Paracoccus albus]|uniref:SCO family protein n=1 Tax=Paracoccus albus TaxID=3017784 RepID=UPI0022F03D85|nr:SCO family protein [Paracoccus albus]WBU60050.1 SCO family protein [Paracoccus albus]